MRGGYRGGGARETHAELSSGPGARADRQGLAAPLVERFDRLVLGQLEPERRLGRGERQRLEGDFQDDTERAEGPRHQARDVVAGDVFHDLPAEGEHFTAPVHDPHAEHEITQRARRLAARPRKPRRDHAAERRTRAKLSEMRRLESEHLAVLAHCSLDIGEPRAAAGGDHELRGLVGNDAAVAARIENLAFESVAVEVLGAAAAQAQRALRATRRAYRFGQLLEHRVHCVGQYHRSLN